MLVYLSIRSVCGGRLVQYFNRVCDLSEYLCLGECASKPHSCVSTVHHNYLIVKTTHASPTHAHALRHKGQPKLDAEFAKKYILKCHTFWHNSVVQHKGLEGRRNIYLQELARASTEISTSSTSIYSIWQTHHTRSSLAPSLLPSIKFTKKKHSHIEWPWPLAGHRYYISSNN